MFILSVISSYIGSCSYRSVAYSVVLPRDFHNRLGCYVTGLILCCLASNYDCGLSILVWRYNRIGVA